MGRQRQKDTQGLLASHANITQKLQIQYNTLPKKKEEGEGRKGENEKEKEEERGLKGRNKQKQVGENCCHRRFPGSSVKLR